MCCLHFIAQNLPKGNKINQEWLCSSVHNLHIPCTQPQQLQTLYQIPIVFMFGCKFGVEYFLRLELTILSSFQASSQDSVCTFMYIPYTTTSCTLSIWMPSEGIKPTTNIKQTRIVEILLSNTNNNDKLFVYSTSFCLYPQHIENGHNEVYWFCASVCNTW